MHHNTHSVNHVTHYGGYEHGPFLHGYEHGHSSHGYEHGHSHGSSSGIPLELIGGLLGGKSSSYYGSSHGPSHYASSYSHGPSHGSLSPGTMQLINLIGKSDCLFGIVFSFSVVLSAIVGATSGGHHHTKSHQHHAPTKTIIIQNGN